MDETKGAGLDTPPGTGQSSDSDEGTTSKQPETYTKEQVDKIRSDTLATAGRERAEIQKAADAAKKALDDSMQRLSDLEAEIETLRKEKDDTELEAARQNPDALSVLQAKQALRTQQANIEKKEREIQRREAEIEESTKALREAGRMAEAQQLAREYDVDAQQLIDLTDGSRDKMEALAKRLQKPAASGQESTTKPDSGVTTGTRGKLTKEQAHKLPMDQYAQAVKEGRI